MVKCLTQSFHVERRWVIIYQCCGSISKSDVFEEVGWRPSIRIGILGNLAEN